MRTDFYKRYKSGCSEKYPNYETLLHHCCEQFKSSVTDGLRINSGVRQWRGHGVATGALFGVPSDILIWPHFHSQAAVPFVMAGVCQSVDNGEKPGW